MALLPDRRTPFQNGSQTDRKSAVQALSDAIDADDDLVAVRVDVNAFYTQLSEALSAQKGNISGTKGNSNAVDKGRVGM